MSVTIQLNNASVNLAILFNGKMRRGTVESGGQTHPGYIPAPKSRTGEGGRSETPKSISSIPEIHCKATGPVPLALCLCTLRRSRARKEEKSPDIARLQACTHRASNCKLVKTREALDKHAASKYKDRSFEDEFASIRSGPGRIKEARAKIEKKLRRGKAKETRHFREQETLVCKSLYRVGGIVLILCLFLFSPSY